MPKQPQQKVSECRENNPDTDLEKGLSNGEAAARTAQFGLNELERVKPESVWLILIRQINSRIVYILAAAAVGSFMLGDRVEGFAILAVILINAITGFTLEYNARQSMEALRKLDTTPARVLRDGQIRESPSEEVTRGDILMLEAGDLVAADAALIEINQLSVDESALTGESVPSEKDLMPSEKNAQLGDQHDRVSARPPNLARSPPWCKAPSERPPRWKQNWTD